MSDSVRGTWRILCKVVPLNLIKLFNLHAFLGAFAKFRKAADSFVRSVCPSVCNNSAPTGRTFTKCGTSVFFVIMSTKIQVSLKSDKNKGYLLEDQYKFLIISHSLLLKMRNVLDKIVQKNKTHTLCSIYFFFSKIVPFMRK